MKKPYLKLIFLKVKQFFCQHKYDIKIVAHMQNKRNTKVPVQNLTAECFCKKCDKKFVVKHF